MENAVIELRSSSETLTVNVSDCAGPLVVCGVSMGSVEISTLTLSSG